MNNNNNEQNSRSQSQSTTPKKRRRRRKGKGQGTNSTKQAIGGISPATNSPGSLETEALSLLLGTIQGLARNVDKLSEKLEEIEHRVNTRPISDSITTSVSNWQKLESPSPQTPAKGLGPLGLGGGAAKGNENADFDPVIEQRKNQRRIASINEELARIDQQEWMQGTERIMIVGKGSRPREEDDL